MAKRKKTASVNKSQAIREYFAEHPDAKPKAAAEALAEKGIVVSAAFVSTIRSTAKRKGGRPVGRPGRKPGIATDSSLETLIQAKKLADQMGGVDAARRALGSLERILAG